jgi:drug/metabolite transporter (DMT)-like permease
MDGHFSIMLARMAEQNARVFLPFNLLIAIFAASTASTFIRLAQAEGAPSLVIAAIRLTIATLILAPLAWMRHRTEFRALTRRDSVLIPLAGIFLALHFATWISSLEYTSVASSVVFVSTSPLWVAILSPMFLNERLSGMAVFGLVLALVGGTVIGLSDACVFQNGIQCQALNRVLQGRAMWGNILALCGALAVSGYLLIGRKVRATRSVSLIPYIFLVYGICALVLTVFMLAAKKTPVGYSSAAYGWIFLLAVIPQLIGHSTFNWLLKHLSATMVAVTTLAEPIGSAVLAYVFLKESPSRAVFIGGALILTGIFLTSRQTNDSFIE